MRKCSLPRKNGEVTGLLRAIRKARRLDFVALV